MKNYDDNIKTHEWTHTHTQERSHSDGNLYNTYILAEVTRTRQQNSSKQKGEEGELPVVLSWSCQERERLEGIDFNKGFEQAVQLVAYNGRRFDFTVLKKQSSEYADESVMDA